MAYNMMGTKKQLTKATAQAPRQASPAPAKRSPENEAAYQRVLRLTTSPATAGKGYAPITHHDVHFHHVLDVLATGVNQVQDRGDVSQDTLDRMHGSLHSAMLHLDAHSAADRRSRFDEAAGHLKEAAGHLGKVAEQVGRHLGKTVTHVDGTEYPAGFLKQHVDDLSKHYTIKVAKNDVTSVPKPADTHTLSKEDFSDKRGKMDTSPEARVVGRVSHMSEISYPQPHAVSRAEAEQRRTNTVTKRSMTPAEAKLASLPPKKAKLTGQQHYEKAISDLETTGKIHPDQLKALRGKKFTAGAKAGHDILDYAYETTGVPNPAKAGAKAPKTASTPMPRDREL